MRFLILTLIALSSSISMATGHDFNGMITEVSQQESRLHKKLLRSLQNTQTAVAYNDRWEQIKGADSIQDVSFSVRLVRATK